MKRIEAALAGLFFTLASAQTSADAATVFSERHAFSLASGPRVIDTFEDPGYVHVMTDAAMSAVLGETDYVTYGGNIVDYNNIMAGFGVGRSKAYCSLCYGSFRLSFDSTSVTSGGGVYGAGVDITLNSGATLPFRYSALVTFVGGATARFELPFVAERYPSAPDHQFWGITAEAGIRSIDFVSHASSGAERTFLIVDNLTLAAAAVPEAPTFALMLAGLCALGVAAAGAKPGNGRPRDAQR